MKSELLEHLRKLAAKGGRKRWINTSKRQRAEEMSRLAKLRWDARKPKRSARLSNDKLRHGGENQ